MQEQINTRGFRSHFIQGRHLNLTDLQEEARHVDSKYLFKDNIPAYPRPEFHVSHLRHDTGQTGLSGIRRDGGFKAFGNHLLWWSLAVGAEDVTAAETRLLEETFPDRTEEQAERQESFLGRFATSPAFMETSRMGSYRLTFPVEEVLKAYSEQLCLGEEPVMRVYETVLYKQEVMYTVLVHSPANQEQFSRFPLLTDGPNAVCAYQDGHFIWRPEAMCETHSYELIERRDENLMDVVRQVYPQYPQFYVWDHVTMALHMEDVLEFDAKGLRENLTFCRKGKPIMKPHYEFVTFEEAEDVVNQLWPEYPGPLKKEMPLESASHIAEAASSD